MQTEPMFSTGDAMAVASLDRKVWNNLMQRGQYEAAPAEPRTGHPRMFTVDDMIAVYVLSHFTPLGAPVAAQIATLVKRELDRSASAGTTCSELWIELPSEGKPPRVFTEQPARVFTHCVDVAKARAVIEQFAIDRLGWRRPE